MRRLPRQLKIAECVLLLPRGAVRLRHEDRRRGSNLFVSKNLVPLPRRLNFQLCRRCSQIQVQVLRAARRSARSGFRSCSASANSPSITAYPLFTNCVTSPTRSSVVRYTDVGSSTAAGVAQSPATLLLDPPTLPFCKSLGVVVAVIDTTPKIPQAGVPAIR